MVILRRHNCTDATCIQEHFLNIKEKKWDFLIYRTCYYDNPEQWNRFMERLKEFAHIGLLNYDPEGDGAAIINNLEWNVQENPAMEECSVDDVRRRHRDLMCSLYGAFSPAFIHHKYPLFIDKESVDSVIAGPAPGVWRASDSRNPSTYVIVMNMWWWDRQEEEARRGPWPDYDDDDEEECYPLINRCQMYDVGWTKMSVRKLYPGLYSLLSDSDLWHVVYTRPPKISTGGP